MCEKWAHIECVDISEEVYGLYHQFDCNLPWFCSHCLEEIRHLKASTTDLLTQNKLLRVEVAQLRDMEGSMIELKAVVKKLVCDVAFLTQADSAGQVAHSSHLPNIPAHPNPFQPLDNESLDHSVSVIDTSAREFPKTPPSLPANVPSANPLPLLAHSASMLKGKASVGQTAPAPLTTLQSVHSTSAPQKSIDSTQVSLYLRGIPSSFGTQEIVDNLANEGFDTTDLTIEPVLSDSNFTGKRKFVQISFRSLDACNSLDQALKCKPNLGWFLSLYPPQKRYRNPRAEQSPSFLGYGLQTNHPPRQRHKIPSLMSLKLPPLLPQCTVSPVQFRGQPPQQNQIPTLMSLQLPPILSRGGRPPLHQTSK